MPRLSLRFATLILPAMLAVLSLPAQAAEVTLRNGQELQVQEMTYDGATGQFGFLVGGNRLRFPAAEVRFVRADQAQMQALSEEYADFQQAAAETAGRLAEAEALLAETNAELERLQRQARSLQEQRDESAEETRSRIENLENENRQLQSNLRSLASSNEEISQQLQQALDELSLRAEPASPAPPIHFEISDLSWKASEKEGFVEVIGGCENPSDRVLSDLVIEVWAEDSAGRILSVAHTFISDFDALEKRPFRADLDVAADEVAIVKAKAVAHLDRQ